MDSIVDKILNNQQEESTASVEPPLPVKPRWVVKKKVVSLAVEEVDDNNDELVEMRGGGRYFGNADQTSERVCSNCGQAGHIQSKCKVVVCHKCGAVGDHYSEECPKTIKCSNCGATGHHRGQCKERQKRIYCSRCDSNRHTELACPDIWRSYIHKKDEGIAELPVAIYCYNCGNKGHYGDDCEMQRVSRVPNINGSAFRGGNLPKHLRDIYWKNIRDQRLRGDNLPKRSRMDDDYSDRDRKRQHYSPNSMRIEKRSSTNFSPRYSPNFNSYDRNQGNRWSDRYDRNRPQSRRYDNPTPVRSGYIDISRNSGNYSNSNEKPKRTKIMDKLKNAHQAFKGRKRK